MTRKNTIQEAELSGVIKNNPSRYTNEASLEGETHELEHSKPPTHLDEDVQEAWFEITTYCIPSILKFSDALEIEVFAELLTEFRSNPRLCPSAKVAQLLKMTASFGMNPLARQRLSAEMAGKGKTPAGAGFGQKM